MIIVVQKPSNNFVVQKQAVLRVKVAQFNIPNGITNAVFTAKGQIIVGTGNGTYVVVPPGADGTYLKYDSSQIAGVNAELPTFDVNDVENKLINGGFNFAQRQTPGTLTTISNATYGPDQWKCFRENADLQYQRVDASGESGLTSPYFGEFKKITNAGKFLICQPLEYLYTLSFRGRPLSFQLKMKSNAARTMRIAIAELQSAGVADTIPAVVSAWNIDGTDPTFGANIAVIGTPVSCSVTTGWQTFQFTGTFPTTSKNLIVMIWSNADVAANDTVGVAEADLGLGTTLRSWSPRPIEMELALCRRYYEKSKGVDIAPSAVSLLGIAFAPALSAISSLFVFGSVRYQVPKRVPGTPIVRPYTTPTNTSRVSDAGGGDLASNSGVPSYIGENGFTVYNNSGGSITPSSGGFIFHWEIDVAL